MSDTNKSNCDRLFTQITQIAIQQFSFLPTDLIRDLALGAIQNTLLGNPPSSLILAAAYDMNIEPTARGIIDFIFADRKA